MVYLLLGTGFEEIEAFCCADIFRRGGVRLELTGVAGLEVTGSRGVAVRADTLMSRADPERAEMLLLPGGDVDAQGNFGSSPAAEKFIRGAFRAGVPVGAICAAPVVLDRLGLIDGKRCTCYPDLSGRLRGAAYVPDVSAVTDGRLVTGRGPGAAMDFALAALALLKGADTAKQVAGDMYYDWRH